MRSGVRGQGTLQAPLQPALAGGPLVQSRWVRKGSHWSWSLLGALCAMEAPRRSDDRSERVGWVRPPLQRGRLRLKALRTGLLPEALPLGIPRPGRPGVERPPAGELPE